MAPARRGRRIATRAVEVVAYVGLAVAAAVVAVVIALRTDWGRDVVRRQVQDAVQPRLRGELSIGAIEGPILGSFTLRDVAVTDERGNEVIAAERVEVDYAPFDLLLRRIWIDEAHIEAPRVRVRRGPDGALNLSRLLVSPEEPAAEPRWVFRAEDVTVSGGRVTYDGADGARTTLGGIELAGGVRTAGDEVRVDLDRARARWHERDLELGARGVVERDGETIAGRRIVVRAGKSRLAIPVLRADGTREIFAAVTLRAGAADVRALADRPQWTGDVRLAGTVWRAFAEQPIRAALSGTVAGAGAAVLAVARPEVPSADVAVDIDGLDPAEALAGAPAGDLDARISAAIRGPTLEQAAGRAELAVAGQLGGQRIERATATARLAGGTLTGELVARAPFATVRGEGTVALTGPQPLVLGAQVTAEVPALSAVPGAPDVGGRARADLSVLGPASALLVTGDVSARNLRYGDFRVDRVTGDVALTGVPSRAAGRAELTARGVSRAGVSLGTVRADVRVAGGGQRFIVDLSAGEGQPLGLDGRVEIDLGDGSRDGPKKGPSDRQRGGAGDGEPGPTARLDDLDVTTRGLTWRGDGSDVAVRGGALTMAPLSLRSEAGQLTVAGEVRGPGDGWIRVDIDRMELGRALAAIAPDAPELTGVLELRGRVRLGDWRGRVEGQITGLSAPGRIPPTDVSFFARLRDRRLELSLEARGEGGLRADARLAARAPARVQEVSAWARLGADAIERASVELDEVGVGLIARALGLPEPEGGVLAASLEIGDRAGTGQLTAEISGLEYARPLPPATAEIEAELDGREVAASAAVNAAPVATGGVSLALTLPRRRFDPEALRRRALRGLASLEATAGADLGQLARLVPGLPELAGSASLEARARDGLSSGRIEARVRALEVADLERPVTAEVTADLGARQTSAAITAGIEPPPPADAAGPTELVSGEVTVPAGSRELVTGGVDRLVAAEARGEILVRLPLTLVRRTLALEEPVGGLVRAKVAIAGPVRDPTLKTWLDASSASLSGVSFDQLRAVATLAAGDVSARLRARQASGGVLDLEARAPARDLRRGTLSANARSFDVAFLSPVLALAGAPITDLAGELSAELELADGGELGLDGTVRLADGRVTPTFARPLEDVSARVTFTDGRAVAALAGRADGGGLQADVRATLDGLAPRSFRAEIDANAFPVAAGGRVVVALDLDANLTGELRRDLWMIDARLDEAVFQVPTLERGRRLHDTGELEDVVYAGEPGDEPEEDPGTRGRPIARIDLDAPEDIVVRGEDLSARIESDLIATILPEGVALQGELAVTRGRVRLLDRRYDIARALIRFGGRVPPAPRLDLLLRHEFDILTLFIDVGGTLDDPTIAFSADPGTYDQAQLLGFVLGGNPDIGSEPVRDRTLETQTASVASSLVAQQLESIVEETFPIDVLRVGADPTEEDAVGFLTVGKWVSEDLFVAYRRRFDPEQDENINEVELEYQLLRRWSLEATGGPETGSVDLLWIRRYE